MRSALVHIEELGNYKLSENHPYDPSRGQKAYELIERHGLLRPGMEVVSAKPVSMDDLALVHGRPYLELLSHAGEGEFYLNMLEYGIGTEDCPVFPGLVDFLSVCVGATMKAGELVVDHGYDFAFNPLGGFHHAGRSMAEGFCYVNDINLAAKRWIDRGLKVLVIDIDAHHGNGTQDFFYADPRVMTMSFHESGETLFPWGGDQTEIGDADGIGYNINVPLPANSDDEIFIFAFTEIFPPVLEAFGPDVVIGVMGVDTFSTDPLTHLKMTNNSYVQAAKIINKLSPRWIALGAGGYNMDNVTRGWTLLWAAVHALDEQDNGASTLGGVFIGHSDLGVSSLRDPTVRTSGPEKTDALQNVEQAVDFIKDQVFPVIRA